MTEGEETIFSKIIRKEIPADIVYESENVLAFRDISPQAPTHVLVIPKKYIRDINGVVEEDAALIGEMVLAAKHVAEEDGIAAEGYRLVVNTGEPAGQTVFHLHMHILGGRMFGWPPG